MTYPAPQTPVPGAGNETIKKNALIAMIVGFLCGGVIPGIFGLLGYLKADQEPETARKFTKWAWIALIIMWVLTIIFVIIYFVFIVAMVNSTSTY
ncbi:hypothetical protein Bequi_06320 [Brachybacterium sp. JHP9]|uniref:DUF4190 domain-containing protein n=1 Tax=Brachybacterium equifaecis TaxID=2910770 RepID=A0ABT0QZE2_9MICO|nr:hypothetical protein [Brachybacterium equifaecis]MCL6423006.1 hypothetical protein [Brachybacterium equifaecis]